MFRNRLRLVAAVLLVLLAAPSWGVPEARRSIPAPEPGSEVGLPALFARVWAAVAQRWQKNGMSADPYGQCAPQENGMSADPFGQCGPSEGASADGPGS